MVKYTIVLSRGEEKMNKYKKISLAMLAFIITAIANAIPVSAAWIQNDKAWQYTKGELYSIGWDKIDGDWYYFNNNGIMETGWINYNDEYYYLSDSGALDESKTTTVMPDEIQTIYNIVNIYKDSGVIKYTSKGYSSELGLSGKELYKFYSEDQLGIKISEYYYDSSNGNVYKSEQGIIKLLNTNTTISNNNTSITTVEAVDKVKDYLFAKGKNIPDKIEVESDNGSKYEVHCYNDSYNSINDWYYVDKYTGNVTAMY